MITDPNIREQAYQYFIEEAPELLHTIEQELSSLNNLDPQGRPLKINGLMRAAHTLKGGAANVGLEAINKVSHTLEDVFKALYNPDIEIDAEIQTLLFENYECLRLLLTAELNHGTIDQEEILDRSAEIFVKLQDKIGEDWTEQDAFPSSEELGLDVVESFFSQVIPERLEEISVVLNNSDSAKVAEVLRSQGEVFLALAESLNLPGFQEIAQGILTAIETNADRAIEIAQVALINLKDAQEQVLTGDRDRGGEPSESLIQLTTRQDVVEE
ncbi:MAG: Hpt domain-containing protein [Prochloraceae cyanobacterium]